MSEKLEAVATSEAPAALGAYSQAVKANGFVFVSGQLGIDPATGELSGETAGEQAAHALKNIKHILDTAGSGIEHVVRATIYMKNVEDFHEVDDVYAQTFIGSVKPARVACSTWICRTISRSALSAITSTAWPLAATTFRRARSSRSTPSPCSEHFARFVGIASIAITAIAYRYLRSNGPHAFPACGLTLFYGLPRASAHFRELWTTIARCRESDV